jgi:hypothetical protein
MEPEDNSLEAQLLSGLRSLNHDKDNGGHFFHKMVLNRPISTENNPFAGGNGWVQHKADGSAAAVFSINDLQDIDKTTKHISQSVVKIAEQVMKAN